jgi:hypothetical protein
MTEPRMVRSFQYVNRSYQEVCALLLREPLDVLQRATTSASKRTKSLATSLRVTLSAVEISVDVRLFIRHIREDLALDGSSRTLRLQLTWEAMTNPGLFPSMLAELSVGELSGTETQIEIHGAYWTPMGPLGAVIDAAVGHRLAEAVVHRFLVDLVEQIRSDLPVQSPMRDSHG